tara:strand:- start:345 stop:869 length:525 start_codon:yes stop_codon:yes gene_type:complete
MKYFVKIFVVTYLLLICTHSFAEGKIAYIDMSFVLNKSKAGAEAQDFLKKSIAATQKKFVEKEKELKKEETNLLEKKSIITKEEYKKKTDELRKKVIEYQSQRKSSLDAIAKKRSEARKKLLDAIDPIVEAYTKENSISIVVDKKAVLFAVPETDITNTVVEKLNKTLPSLNLK